MKKLKVLLITAACFILLTACGTDTEAPIEPDDTSVSSTPQKTEIDFSNPITDSVIAEDDSLPPQEGMVRSRLTNEWVDAEVAATRPLAVVIPNEKAAIPHYGLSKASVLYEATVEGQMTRLMAVFEDWTEMEQIGNIRSLRTYFGYWAFEWDAFIVHYGGPYYIDEMLARTDTHNINGNNPNDNKVFFRTDDRKEPHNAYVSGPNILNHINTGSYSLEYRDLADEYHYNFTTKAYPNTLLQYDEDARNATYIDMSGCYPLTRCYFEYNEEDGLYYRFQHLSGGTDGPHVDESGEQLAFKNILIQNVYYEDLGDGYLVYQCHDNTRDGWYFTNGKGIHITWEKSTDYGATRYYDDSGNEIVMNVGKTMVCVVEDGDKFTFH